MKRLIMFAMFLALAVTTVNAQQTTWPNWTKVYNYVSGWPNGLFSVQATDSLHIVVVGRGTVGLIYTTDGGLNWQTPAVPYNSYRSVCMLNNQVGYAAGNNTLLKTKDGWQTWVTTHVTNTNLNIISFVNEKQGWATGFYSGKSSILRTNDSGVSWQNQLTLNLYYLRGIYFANSNLGWVCGDSSIVARTTNGGQEWIVNRLPGNIMFKSVSFVDSKNGWVTGGDLFTSGGSTFYVFRTTDSGVSWQKIHQTQNHDFYWIQMVDSLTGYIVGQGDVWQTAYGTVFKTTDGGYTWNKVYQNNGVLPYYGISFLNSNYGFVCGMDGVIKYSAKPNHPPYFVSGVTDTTIVAGKTFSRPVVATDNDSAYIYFDSLYVTKVSGPNKMNIERFNKTTFMLSWRPALADTGVHVIVLRVKDYQSAYTDSLFRISVQFINHPPILEIGPIDSVARAGTPFNVAYYAFDTDSGDYVTVTLDYSVTPAWLAIDSVNNKITGAVPVAMINKWFKFKVIATDTRSASTSFTSDSILVIPLVGVDDKGMPTEFNLSQNYPNPFNPTTTIKFSIPPAYLMQYDWAGRHSAFVTLKVYDILGKEVATLVSGAVDAGYHSYIWDGKNQSGKDVSSGIYLYRIEADKFSKTMKLLLLR